ncbi:hypothetical protein [Thiomonas sp.]|jgi:hypothetical protein|uniref:hypothetical protein n=1 Tax=Thiomonas sp. TaxID=2047785 RepID=UPI00262AEE43|nr:hypothetical protein [Thiomonas sp.]
MSACAGDRGAPDCRPARWIGLAASPSFGLMALGSVLAGTRVDALCGAMQGSSALFGMTAMYLLMAVFHLPPWVRLLYAARRAARTAARACP